MSAERHASLLLLSALLLGGSVGHAVEPLADPPEALDAPLLPVPGLLRTRKRPNPGPVAAQCDVAMLPQVPDRLPFGPGERLDFDVKFFGFRTGGITLRMDGRERVDGRTTYPVRAVGRTEGAATMLGGIDVRMMSWLDPARMTPVRMASRALQSPMIGKDLLVREDAAFSDKGAVSGQLKWWRNKQAKQSAIERSAKPDLVDVLGLLYYARSRVFEEGSAFCFTVFHRRTLWRVEGEIGRTELVRAPYGTREASKINANIRRVSYGKLSTDATPVTVWVSRDRLRLPLVISTPEGFGTIEAVLARHTPGRQLIRRKATSN